MSLDFDNPDESGQWADDELRTLSAQAYKIREERRSELTQEYKDLKALGFSHSELVLYTHLVIGPDGPYVAHLHWVPRVALNGVNLQGL